MGTPGIPRVEQRRGVHGLPQPLNLNGRLLHMTLGPEQPTTYQDEALVLHKDIARQVLFGSSERSPSLPSTTIIPRRQHDPILAAFFQKCNTREFEVFLDGSLRVPTTTALDHAFP